MGRRSHSRLSRASAATIVVGLLLAVAAAATADVIPRATPPEATAIPTPTATVDDGPETRLAVVARGPGTAGAGSGGAVTNVYAATTGQVRADLRDVPARVYVPNEHSNTVSVIDAVTLKVIREIKVGASPEHIAPGPDLARLYVDDDGLTEIDPRTSEVTRHIPVQKPYNLYFTEDGKHAIVVAEDLDRLDIYGYPAWAFERSIAIPWKGIDHMDMSSDGSFLIATTEYAGVIVKIDLRDMAIVGSAKLASLPVDVRLSPDGTRFYVTDQGRHGVIVIDPATMTEKRFIPTGRGAHGLAISRDTRFLYVSDRLEGTIAVIDTSKDAVVARWIVGGSPDMLQVSPDGTQLWFGDRFADTVAVIDTRSGKVISRIKVGRSPHGLTYFPQPGNISLGHNGVYR
jgi:YVTN family beta-propeller protein